MDRLGRISFEIPNHEEIGRHILEQKEEIHWPTLDDGLFKNICLELRTTIQDRKRSMNTQQVISKIGEQCLAQIEAYFCNANEVFSSVDDPNLVGETGKTNYDIYYQHVKEYIKTVDARLTAASNGLKVGETKKKELESQIQEWSKLPPEEVENKIQENIQLALTTLEKSQKYIDLLKSDADTLNESGIDLLALHQANATYFHFLDDSYVDIKDLCAVKLTQEEFVKGLNDIKAKHSAKFDDKIGEYRCEAQLLTYAKKVKEISDLWSRMLKPVAVKKKVSSAKAISITVTPPSPPATTETLADQSPTPSNQTIHTEENSSKDSDSLPTTSE